jgi:type I restriction enzyme, S subunit
MSSKKKNTGMKEDGKPALLPKLRFPEFRNDGEWGEGRIADIATVLQGYGFPEKHQGQTSGDYPFYKVSDISRSLAAGKVFIGESANYINESLLKELRAKPIPEGTTIFAKIGEAIRSNKRTITTVPCLIDNNAAGVKRIKGKANDFFIFLLMEQISLIDHAGGVVPAVNKSAIEEIPVRFPKIDEQNRIAECLRSVDEVIAAQARKVDALKTHKKGLMQQLFPREGETQPRLRFPEFRNDGEWSEKTVGDVSDVFMCKRIFAEETNPNEGVPFYKIGTLGGVPDAFISSEKFEDYKSRYNYPRRGEVLITCSGTVGKCLPFDGKDAYFQDSNIVWLDNPTGEVSNEFLLMLLSNVNWGRLNSTTITRIYGPDLRGLAIKYPEDEAEQQRIASCLSSLDALITLETQKLEALKRHKRGLMQQLFPSPEEAEI